VNLRTTNEPRSSNLDLLRLITATAVIFGHAYALNKVKEPGFLGDSVGYLRVKVFFVMSGALLARSWIRDPHFLRYFARRMIRLLPGLTLVVLVTAFVIGPIVSTFSVSEYFQHPLTWKYLRNIYFYPQYYLPGVFLDLPLKGGINGSLWSLAVEVMMYLLLPVVLWLGQKTRLLQGVAWAVTLALCGWSIYWSHISPPDGPVVFFNVSMRGAVGLAPFFMIGALLGLRGWHKRMSLQWSVAAVILMAFFTPTGVLLSLVTFLLIPMLVLSLGFSEKPVFAWVSGYGDYAYGIYLWGFPVQQILISLWGGPMPPVLNFALTLPIAFFLAVVSWHGVEKWFLKLRPAVPSQHPGHAPAGGVISLDASTHGDAPVAAVTGSRQAAGGQG